MRDKNKILKGGAVVLLGLMVILYNSPGVSFVEFMFFQLTPNYSRFFGETDAFNHTDGMAGIGDLGELVTSVFDINALDDGGENSGMLSVSSLEDLIQTRGHFTGERFGLNFSAQDMENFRNVSTLLGRFYVLERNPGINNENFSIDYFINANLHVEKNEMLPQILIFHSHAASEFFRDSPNTTDLEYGIVGVGNTLANILRNEYGLNVLHYTGVYDMVNGVVSRDGAYERIEPSIVEILDMYPSIELVIDLHRDGVPESTAPEGLFTEIDGQRVAQIMFVNGVSAMNIGGEVRNSPWLENPYINTNLALSFNLQMAKMSMYPGLSRRMFITPFRYINHLRPLSVLIEVGTQRNTMQDVHNAMDPLANVIYSVVFA